VFFDCADAVAAEFHHLADVAPTRTNRRSNGPWCRITSVTVGLPGVGCASWPDPSSWLVLSELALECVRLGSTDRLVLAVAGTHGALLGDPAEPDGATVGPQEPGPALGDCLERLERCPDDLLELVRSRLAHGATLDEAVELIDLVERHPS